MLDDAAGAEKVLIQSKSGQPIKLDDTAGAEKIVLTDKGSCSMSSRRPGSRSRRREGDGPQGRVRRRAGRLMATGPLPLRGFAFPFRIDPRSGSVAATEGPEKLTENLERLLLARVGERLMLPDYGGGASALVQENINDGLIAVARIQIAAAILRYEPRRAPAGRIGDPERG